MRGRKAIDPSEKKTLIRVFVKRKIVDAFTPEQLQQQVNNFINTLIQNCANEALKMRKYE